MHKLLVTGALMLALVGGARGENLTRFGTWFDQDYSGFDAANWTDTLGVWSYSGTGKNVFVPGEKPHIELNPGEEFLTFAPNAATAGERATAVEFVMRFQDGSAEDLLPADAKAGFTLNGGEDGCVFSGYTANGWIELGASGVTAEPDRDYLVRMELEYRTAKAHSEDPFKKIAYVSYSVDGVRLADAAGASWFPAPAAANKGAVGEIGFAGFGGSVGEIRGSEHLAPRAKVEFPLTRAKAGTAFAFNVSTNEGATLSGELTTRWFVGDWAGSYGDAPASSAATYAPTADDYAHWVKAVVYDDAGYAGEGRFWYSKLPVFYITTDDGKMPTASKEGHEGRLSVQGNDLYKNDYDGKLAEVKVRGNSTKGYPKKPYKLKLDKKADIFGLSGGTGAKNKHWVLLANYLDESSLRNVTGYGVSAALGMENVIHSTWVDVVFNGEYLGLYQLAEHIRVGEDRVSVYDWEDAGEKLAGKIVESDPTLTADDEDALAETLSTDFGWVTSGAVTYTNGVTYQAKKVWKKYTDDISGGYLVEFSNEYDELSKFVVTSRTVSVITMVNKPECLYTNPTMMDWLRDYLQDYFDGCTAADGYDSKGRHYSELADARQMAAYLLTMEVMGNNDASYKSRWAYKQQGEKLKFGPAWDFDWGCASPVSSSWKATTNADGVVTWSIPYSQTNGWRVAQYAGSNEVKKAGGYMLPGFWKEWPDDPFMAQQMVDVYRAARPALAELVRDGGTLDSQIAYLRESAAANESKWLYKIGFSGGATDVRDPGDAAWFKYYLAHRLLWLDTIFDKGGSELMAKIRTSKSAAPYTRSTDVGASYPVSEPVAHPADPKVGCASVAFAGVVPADLTAKEGASVRVYVNGLLAGSAALANGAAAVRIPATAFDPARTNVVAFDAVDAQGAILLRNWSLVSGSAATPVPDKAAVPPGGAAVAIPYAWLNEKYPAVTNNPAGAALPADYAALANKLEGGLSPLGKSVPFSYDYVAGTEPSDPTQFLTVEIDMDEMTDGVPKITPVPKLDGRVYTVLGTADLIRPKWEPATSDHRFFKVKVSVP